MRTLLKTSLATLALVLALPACAKQPAAPTKAAASADADPALWVVKDADTTIYLFGTVHVLKPGLSWFDEAVKAAFDRSDQLVLELVMPDATTMQKLVQAQGVNATGPALTAQLPENKRAAFTRAMADAGLPAAAYDRMRPWLAANYLSLIPLGKLGYDPQYAPEQVLTAAAKAENKPVVGLETAEQQLGYFAGISQPAQVKFLVSTLDELPKAGPEMAAMVDQWAHGRSDALARTLNDDLKDSAELKTTLLVNRNKRWATWVENRLKTPGTVFVAVGAGHLAGADALQAQLARDGVKATRVRY